MKVSAKFILKFNTQIEETKELSVLTFPRSGSDKAAVKKLKSLILPGGS